jgi:hypothetical protein
MHEYLRQYYIIPYFHKLCIQGVGPVDTTGALLLVVVVVVDELVEVVELLPMVELFRGRVPFCPSEGPVAVPLTAVELLPPVTGVVPLTEVPLPAPTGRVPLVELDEFPPTGMDELVELVVLAGGTTTEDPLPAEQMAHELARMTLPNLVLIHSAIDSNWMGKMFGLSTSTTSKPKPRELTLPTNL